jgi:hypothetical protein
MGRSDGNGTRLKKYQAIAIIDNDATAPESPLYLQDAKTIAAAAVITKAAPIATRNLLLLFRGVITHLQAFIHTFESVFST